jgi:hypothetical protein
MMTHAKGQRLDFRVLERGIQAKEKQREAELANKLPHLNVFGVVDYADPNPRVFPQSNKFTTTWSVGVSLTWALNDALIARTTDHRLRAETNQLRADRENLERGTRLEVLAAQQAVSLAQHALVTSAKGLRQRKKSTAFARRLLNADRATGVELVDAETDLTRPDHRPERAGRSAGRDGAAGARPRRRHPVGRMADTLSDARGASGIHRLRLDGWTRNGRVDASYGGHAVSTSTAFVGLVALTAYL